MGAEGPAVLRRSHPLVAEAPAFHRGVSQAPHVAYQGADHALPCDEPCAQPDAGAPSGRWPERCRAVSHAVRLLWQPFRCPAVVPLCGQQLHVGGGFARHGGAVHHQLGRWKPAAVRGRVGAAHERKPRVSAGRGHLHDHLHRSVHRLCDHRHAHHGAEHQCLHPDPGWRAHAGVRTPSGGVHQLQH